MEDADETMNERTFIAFDGSPFMVYDVHRILNGEISKKDFLAIRWKIKMELPIGCSIFSIYFASIWFADI